MTRLKYVADTRRASLARPGIERAAFWLAVAAVATLPLEFTKQYSPVSWIELSRLLMVAACTTAAVAVVGRRDRPVVSVLVITALMMVGTAAASILIGEGPFPFRDLFSMVAYLAFAVTLAWTIRSPHDVRTVALAVVGSAVLVALIAVLQQAFDFYVWNDESLGVLDRRNSTLGDPNVAARVMTLGLMAALGVFAAMPRSRSRVTLAMIGVGVTLGIGEALTQSRTIWIVTVVALVAWLPIAWRRRHVALLIGAFVCAVAATAIAAPLVASRAASIPPGATGSADASDGLPFDTWLAGADPTPVDEVLVAMPLDGVRRYLIRAGVAMWVDNPWLGVGLGGFDEKLQSDYWEYVPNERRGRPTTLLHTDAVRVLAETGVVGLAGWLAFVVAFVVSAANLLRSSTWVRFAGMGILSGFLVILAGSQFAGRFSNEPYLWVLVGLLVATSTLATRRRSSGGVPPAGGRRGLITPAERLRP